MSDEVPASELAQRFHSRTGAANVFRNCAHKIQVVYKKQASGCCRLNLHSEPVQHFAWSARAVK
jgi:hypothetical protein